MKYLHSYMSEYLEFKEIEVRTKTRQWSIISQSSGDILGAIKWYGAWRQFTFFPMPGTIWNSGCLTEIHEFLQSAQKDWRESKNEGRN